ncbi:nucleotidyltransferase domain-containing protein [Methanogenium organophilum]|uniref:Nucleotidyltransferase domain-containing protein n=1 Tax=Methanogenium organophilum TaxID=2199 RepID=A0A9X9T7W3_METOG|nr:nucleotidyltransferase domain-containing protein [Methanogenium organophilum]WAI01808.1 nucleotidyltransferase domain-containing protein [Methanogenium organophilum]
MSFGDSRIGEIKQDLTDSDKERIISQITTYLSGVDDLLLGYLYGSFPVRNDFHDIDIGLLVSGEREPYESFRYAMDIASGLEQSITPRFEVDCRILNGAPVLFQYEVVKTGMAVFVRDENIRIDFEAGVMSGYLDQKPLFDRMDKMLLAPVRE